LIIIVLLSVNLEMSAQSVDTMALREENLYSVKQYKVFYQKQSLICTDSLVIANPLFDIIECHAYTDRKSIVVFYSTDGTNNTTKGITLHIERYNIEHGKIIFDNKCILAYGANDRFRQFRYEINNGQLLFKPIVNEIKPLSYSLLDYPRLEVLKELIYQNITRKG